MAPRVGSSGLCSWFNSLSLSRVGSQPSRTVTTKSNVRRRRDPFAMAQARQRKAANISRQRELTQQRTTAFGDPVASEKTPMIEAMLNPSLYPTLGSKGVHVPPNDEQSSYVNFCISKNDLASALEKSKQLTRPVPPIDGSTFDPQEADEALKKHEEDHKTAEEAVRRILAMKNGSTRNRTKLNIQRSIDILGRHNTDRVLPPKPAVAGQDPASLEASTKRPRAGPDTGSPEVQVAILTSKILVLAEQLKTTSHKDKHNKRRLRLYVHRRQKLLSYLRRKERGGPRWQNLMQTLGLSDAAWKGEITLR
ncbi:hypothetical protein McanMca71_000257 [Microsporum canis]|uniref:Ribosomal protein S15 n=1 Tax=Arthroderma otae (strain ATCC MYA-4605 / CBS 113480) TaxID=554155 RepID=C5FD75_ARTOC|nr:conserved hypothetical protein [Microsporum canis CBS 113480]EEQ27759.1 conserved hypothetical protein [Microsporum canis CBS 113480]